MPPDPSRFPTTRWTQVLRADAADDAGRQALAWLCERYWYPLYAYVRRRGISSDEAQDLTQEFFGRLIERHTRCMPTRNVAGSAPSC
jgi:RNA polymerase sigma-70 factor (ECF subfamily)